MWSNPNSKATISVSETTTPREVLQRFLNSANLPEGLRKHPLYKATEETPLYTFHSPMTSIPLFKKTDWNTPFAFQNANTYFLKLNLRMREKIEKDIQESLPLLQKVLDHYKETPLKIIYASSAATEDIPKNVNQQFKFDRDPKTPILLIDPGFFTAQRFEFYKYLDFEEKSIEGIPEDRVKIYTKEKGKPLTINPNDTDIRATKQEKVKYLEEVKRQAGLNFDLENEIEICCLKASVDFNEKGKGRFYALLANYNVSVFSFSE